jgi:hypothetical protein
MDVRLFGPWKREPSHNHVRLKWVCKGGEEVRSRHSSNIIGQRAGKGKDDWPGRTKISRSRRLGISLLAYASFTPHSYFGYRATSWQEAEFVPWYLYVGNLIIVHRD